MEEEEFMGRLASLNAADLIDLYIKAKAGNINRLHTLPINVVNDATKAIQRLNDRIALIDQLN